MPASFKEMKRKGHFLLIIGIFLWVLFCPAYFNFYRLDEADLFSPKIWENFDANISLGGLEKNILGLIIFFISFFLFTCLCEKYPFYSFPEFSKLNNPCVLRC